MSFFKDVLHSHNSKESLLINIELLTKDYLENTPIQVNVKSKGGKQNIEHEFTVTRVEECHPLEGSLETVKKTVYHLSNNSSLTYRGCKEWRLGANIDNELAHLSLKWKPDSHNSKEKGARKALTLSHHTKVAKDHRIVSKEQFNFGQDKLAGPLGFWTAVRFTIVNRRRLPLIGDTMETRRESFTMLPTCSMKTSTWGWIQSTTSRK